MSRGRVPFAIGGLDHVVLKVRDVERSLSFYRDVLGAVDERRIAEIGMVQMRIGRSLIDLVPGGLETSIPNMEHFAIIVEPFDETAIAAHLAAHGVAVGEVSERYGADGYGPSIYIEDPDGNRVELKGPAVKGLAQDNP